MFSDKERRHLNNAYRLEGLLLLVLVILAVVVFFSLISPAIYDLLKGIFSIKVVLK